MEEREIDLLDMIADILSHWRGLVVALVIGAVLMGGLSYVKSYQNIQNIQNAQPIEEETTLDAATVEKQLMQLEETLEESQKAAVLTTMDDEREYIWKENYAENSVYMQLDPFNIAQRQLVYQIKATEENQNQSLGTTYGDVLDNVGMYNWVEEKTGVPAAYVKELITVSTTSAISIANDQFAGTVGTDRLKITVIQKDEESCKELSDAVKAYVEQQKATLATEVGNHELILLSESAGMTLGMDVMNRQIDYGNQVSNLRSGIASAKAGFTADQAKYYDLLTGEEGMDEAVSPSVSKKYILLGAVLFAFVYAGILFLVYIFNSKLRVSDELQSLYHIPQIGVVVKDSKKKFILDKWVDDLRHYGKRKFDAEQSMELAFVAVKIAAVKNKLNTICLMGCNLEAGAGSVCENLKTALEKEGINVTVLDNVLYNAESMEKVEAMTGVVLVEKAGSTLYNEVANELALLKRQDITVLGGIIVE